MKLAIQCDFDGTITVGEVSHLLLNEFAGDTWKPIVDEFHRGGMTVTECMQRCFALVRADAATLRSYILSDGLVKVRGGFAEFHRYCRNAGHYFTIVSNGIEFYIDAILNRLDIKDIDIIAGKGHYSAAGMTLEYDGPEAAFKESFTERFKKEGYGIVCIGDSITDLPVAQRARYVFATAALREHCDNAGIEYTPFDDFYQVIDGMERIEKGSR